MDALIRNVHNQTAHAYYGKTYNTLKHEYSWVRRNVVKEWINRSCTICASMKVDHKKSKRIKHKPIESDGVFRHITFDLIDYSHDPATYDGITYNYILHSIDHFSKLTMSAAIQQKSGNEVQRVLESWFTHHGRPTVAQADNGPEFVNQHVINMMTRYGIDYRHGQPYKPTTQGVIERANGVLKKRIAAMIQSDSFLNWFTALNDATYAINTTYHETIKDTPYRVVYGQNPPPLCVNKEEKEFQVDNSNGHPQTPPPPNVSLDSIPTDDVIDFDNVMRDAMNDGTVNDDLGNPMLSHHDIRREAMKSYKHNGARKINDKNKKTDAAEHYMVGQYVGLKVPNGKYGYQPLNMPGVITVRLIQVIRKLD